MTRRVPVRAAPTLDVLCAGEALWDLAPPRGGSFARATRIELSPGGAAINVALALARRGRRVGLVASAGADLLGDALVARIAARGVDTSAVTRGPARTGLVFAERSGHPPRVVSYRAPDEAAPALPHAWRARALVLSGVVPGEAQIASFAHASQAAREQGALVIADLNARPRMWRGARPVLLPGWLADADVVKASEDDLGTLATSTEALRAHLAGSAVLVVTAGPGATTAFGPFGSLVVSPRAAVQQAGRVMMGAGDAFTAAITDLLLDEAAALRIGRTFWERALRCGHDAARRRILASHRARER